MIPFNPSGDAAQVADGIETVHLLRQGSPPETEGLLVAAAMRQAMTLREAAASNGQYTRGDIVWRLPADALDAPPQPGDVLVDAASERWTIVEVVQAPLVGQWRIVARQVRIAAGSTNRISILRASYTKSAGGAAVATWSVWRSNIAARIQPKQASVTADATGARTVERLLVYLAEAIALDDDCRIVGPDDRVYRIVEIGGAQRIGELLTVEVEALP